MRKVLRGAGHEAYSTQVYRDSGGQAGRESIHRPGRTIPRRELGGEPVRNVVRGRLFAEQDFAFMVKKSDATAVLRAIIARYFTPAGLNIGVIWTHNGGEFQRSFQLLLAELGIKHERTPPYTPVQRGSGTDSGSSS